MILIHINCENKVPSEVKDKLRAALDDSPAYISNEIKLITQGDQIKLIVGENTNQNIEMVLSVDDIQKHLVYIQGRCC